MMEDSKVLRTPAAFYDIINERYQAEKSFGFESGISEEQRTTVD